ncbi:chromate transporter [bacterium]|nr:chromate transporter [bacterium]
MLWLLFKEMLIISSFTFGGGYVIVGFLQNRFVQELKLLTEEEMLNLVSIAQSSPGPVAINTAALVGHHLAGWRGLLVAVLGTAIPPLVIIVIVQHIFTWLNTQPLCQAFFRGARVAVAAIVTNVVIGLSQSVYKQQGKIAVFLGAIAALIMLFYKGSSPYVLLGSALFSLCFKRGKEN